MTEKAVEPQDWPVSELWVECDTPLGRAVKCPFSDCPFTILPSLKGKNDWAFTKKVFRLHSIRHKKEAKR